MTESHLSTYGGAEEIRAATVLPADRTPIRLQTADGLELVGELAVPVDREPPGYLNDTTIAGSRASLLRNGTSTEMPPISVNV